MKPTPNLHPTELLELARKCAAQELDPGSSLPDDQVDLVKTGLLDSMGWVGVLSCIEEEMGLRDFGQDWPANRTQSVRALTDALLERVKQAREEGAGETWRTSAPAPASVCLAGWGEGLGSLAVEAGQLDRECGLPPGTISTRAGIRSVRRAEDGQDEVALGQKAAEIALMMAGVDAGSVDFMVATSATFLKFPSLASALHTRLLLRKSCAAFDVGGACVGTLYALATAKALLSDTGQGVALVVASEVHSRRLSRPSVPGEFRGLFGDAACAFVLKRSDHRHGAGEWRLGDFIWGCSGAFASALTLSLDEQDHLDVQFKGEQLASAALGQMAELLDELETRCGRLRSEVDYFALHEPNPRLVALLAERAKIPIDKIPRISETFGNLGSATCGVSLCAALSKLQTQSAAPRQPAIFVAAVGPGLVRGGTYLEQEPGERGEPTNPHVRSAHSRPPYARE